MAPERLQGHLYSFPADIYSFGVTLLTMCAGGHVPLSFVDNIPDSDLKKLIQKCLDSSPELRPSVEVLVADNLKKDIFTAPLLKQIRAQNESSFGNYRKLCAELCLWLQKNLATVTERNPLLSALAVDDIVKAEKLISVKDGSCIFTGSVDGIPPLLFAVAKLAVTEAPSNAELTKGFTKIAQLLLENGASPLEPWVWRREKKFIARFSPVDCARQAGVFSEIEKDERLVKSSGVNHRYQSICKAEKVHFLPDSFLELISPEPAQHILDLRGYTDEKLRAFDLDAAKKIPAMINLRGCSVSPDVLLQFLRKIASPELRCVNLSFSQTITAPLIRECLENFSEVHFVILGTQPSRDLDFPETKGVHWIAGEKLVNFCFPKGGKTEKLLAVAEAHLTLYEEFPICIF
eukprot:TRINITY_DN653_c0_g1_i9.p2 TRINITY_DN653_c0_g1~~TRINITY_DN653_c0_g1_i9.p2  ORF type:complete len:405 (+),score=96.59 TRINITY_DN653_c0_g1_i9:1587-2801(+)